MGYGVQRRREQRFRRTAWVVLVCFVLQLICPGSAAWASPPSESLAKKASVSQPALDPSTRNVLQRAGHPLKPLPNLPGSEHLTPFFPDLVAQNEVSEPENGEPRLYDPGNPHSYPVRGTRANPLPPPPPGQQKDNSASEQHTAPKGQSNADQAQADESSGEKSKSGADSFEEDEPSDDADASGGQSRHDDSNGPQDEERDSARHDADERHSKEDGEKGHTRQVRSFGVITPPDKMAAPNDAWARWTGPHGPYFSMDQTGLKAYANDHSIALSRTYKGFQNPCEDKIVWEFISPVEDHNRLGPHRDAAAAIEFEYVSRGRKRTDKEAAYKIRIRSWDNRHPGGKLRSSTRHIGQLTEYKAWAGCACRDVGTWTFRARRGRQIIEETTFVVNSPPVPEHPWSRRVQDKYNEATELYVAWAGDEWLMRQAEYSFPVPDARLPLESQPEHLKRTKIEWHWKAPNAPELNQTKYHTYLTVRHVYRLSEKNKERSWTLTTTVFDAAYPKGRVYQRSSGEGELRGAVLLYGSGIPFTDLKVTEKINGQTSSPITFKVRHLGTAVQAPEVGYVDNGVMYRMQVSTTPLDYVEPRFNWTLNLRDSETNSLVRTYTGSVENNSKNFVELEQVFDGQDNDGNPVTLNRELKAEFLVQVPKGTGPSGQAAIATAGMPSVETAKKDKESRTVKTADILAAPVDFNAMNATDQKTFSSSQTIDLGGVKSLPVSVSTSESISASSIAPASSNATNLELYQLGISNGQSGATSNPPLTYNVDLGLLNPQNPRVEVGIKTPPTHCSNVSYTVYKDGQAILTTPFLAANQQGTNVTLNLAPGVHTFQVNCTIQPGGCAPWNPFVGSWAAILLLSFNGEPLTDLVPQAESRAISSQSSLLTNAGIWSAAETREVMLGDSQAPVRVVRPNGIFDTVYNDLVLKTASTPISITRYWTNSSNFDLGDAYTAYVVGKRRVQFGWVWSFQRDLVMDYARQRVVHRKPEGGQDVYVLNRNSGQYEAVRPDDMSRLQFVGNGFVLTTKSGYRYVFQFVTQNPDLSAPPPNRAFLVSEADLHGNQISYAYRDPNEGLFVGQISSNTGQSVNLIWEETADPVGFRYGRLASLSDHSGRTIRYGYRSLPAPFSHLSLLERVEQPERRVLTHEYDLNLEETAENGGVVIPPWVQQTQGGARLIQLYSFLQRNPQKIQAQLAGVNVNGVPRLRLAANGKTVAEATHPGVLTNTYQRVSPDQIAIASLPSVGAQQRWLYSTDSGQRVQTAIDPLGNTERFAFDRAQNLLSYTDEHGKTAKLTYDNRRNVLTVTDALNRVSKMTYDGQDNLLTLTNPDNDVVRFTWNNRRDLLQVEDEEHHVVKYSYNSRGQLTQRLDAMGQDWRQDYNGSGYLVSRTAPDGTRWLFQNDSRGNRTVTELPNGRVIRARYDLRDRLTNTEMVDAPGSPGGGTVRTSTLYDANDQVTNTTDTLGRRTNLFYDQYMRLQRVQRPDGTSVSYTYDGLDNVLTMTNPRGAVTSYTYDELNRVKTVTYPAPAGTEKFEYNARGELTAWTKTDGAKVEYLYDEVGNLKKLSSGSTTADFAYDRQDRLTTITDPAGVTSYAYTPASNLKSVTRPGNRTISYFYDDSDRLKRSVDPENLETLFSYSLRDQLIGVNATGLSATYGYNPVGTLSSIRYGGLSSTLDCSLSYDGRDRLIRKAYTKGGNPLLTMGWAFDDGDRRTQMTMNFAQARVSRSFAYNLRDELTTSNTSILPSSGAPSNTTNVYQLDPNHNREQLNNTTYANNLADQTTRAGSESNTFNEAGSIKTIQSGGQNQNFTYDFKDQLTKFVSGNTTVEYVYDIGNRLTRRTHNGTNTTFLWDGDDLVKEYAANGTVDKRYFIGLEREAVFQGGKWHVLLTDHQSSIVGLANDQADLEVANVYADFGELHRQFRPIASSPELDYGWTGCRLDRSIGHHYMRNRWYRASLGKFLQRDPIGYGGGSLNLYAFASSDPINSIDPDGLQPNAPIPGEGGGTWMSTSRANTANRRGSQENMIKQGAIDSVTATLMALWFIYDGWWASGGKKTATTTTAIARRRGSLVIEGKALEREIAVGRLFEARGMDVVVRGKNVAGADLILAGERYELKHVINSNSVNAVAKQLRRGVGQAERIIIDGRPGGVTTATALRAIKQEIRYGRTPPYKDVIFLTKNGEFHWP